MDEPLDPVLAFIRVMWSVDHELQRVSKRMMGSIGLTAPQRLALRFIGLHPGVTPGRLAELLHLHPGTVTGIVARLEALQLVGRERSVDHTRRVHLRLSSTGQRLNRRRRGTVEAAVRRVAAAVSPDDWVRAADVMRRVAAELASE
jgi:DNA-binding MarR family transcriptional regulator